MTKESTILLMKSKLQACVQGFHKAQSAGDKTEAAKWQKSYFATKSRLKELTEK